MSIDPKTGIKPISEWGHECARGFVSNARYGTGLVIERTNRETTKKWRRAMQSGAPGPDEQQLLDVPAAGVPPVET